MRVELQTKTEPAFLRASGRLVSNHCLGRCTNNKPGWYGTCDTHHNIEQVLGKKDEGKKMYKFTHQKKNRHVNMFLITGQPHLSAF